MCKPKSAFFRPLGRFLCPMGNHTTEDRKTRGRGQRGRQAAKPRPRAAAPVRFCARQLARLPARSALRPSGRGAGEFVPRPSVRRLAVVPAVCAPRAGRWPSASVALLCAALWGVLRWRQGWRLACASCCRPSAPSPPVSPPFPPSACVVVPLLGVGWRWGDSRARWPSPRRRSGRLGRWPRSGLRPRNGLPAVRFSLWRRARGPPTGAYVRGFAAFGRRWGGATPAPAGRLRVGGLGGLAAGRALGCVRATGFPPSVFRSGGAPAARLRALTFADSPRLVGDGVGRCCSVSRGRVPLPPPRPQGAPPFPPSCSPSARTRAEI